MAHRGTVGRLTRSSWRRAAVVMFLLLFQTWLATGAFAQTAVEDVLAAVVSVTAVVPADARTAQVLGTKRTGSGAVIDGNGLILTIGYLVLEARKVAIAGDDGRWIPADIVAYDHATGLGLIRAIEPPEAIPLVLGNSLNLDEQDPVLVVSRGDQRSVLAAQIVARRDFAGPWEYLLENAIFTSPPHPYFGGAVLLGPDGALLGIGSLMVQDAVGSGHPSPGNMFVPIDRLKPILADLLTVGRSTETQRPWLGIFTEERQGHLWVTRIAPDGPAEAAGIRVGDMIFRVADKPVVRMADFYREVWALGGPGIDVPLNVRRGNESIEILVHSRDRYDWLKLNTSQ